MARFIHLIVAALWAAAYVQATKKRPAAQRLTDLQRGSYASVRAISRLMREARDEGIPEYTSRTQMWKARNQVASTPTRFGPLVHELELPSGHEVFVQNPMAMLDTCCREAPLFNQFLRNAHARTPSSMTNPWRIVMYFDEVGHNPIGRDNRQLECVYWSFLELGMVALHTEAVWFEVAITRTEIVADLPAKMSQFIRIILNRCFFNDTHSFATGILLHGALMLFATFACVVADEKALKEVLMHKGASGFKFCPCCWKIADHKSTDERLTDCIPGTCLDPRVLETQLNTDETVTAYLQDLKDNDGLPTKEAFNEWSTFIGWTYHPLSLLSDVALRVGAMSVLMHDWAHVYIVSGIFQVEMQCLMIAMSITDNTLLQRLSDFMYEWTWPRHQSNLHNLFQLTGKGKRVDLTKDHFSCDAHEALQSYGIIALFVHLLRPTWPALEQTIVSFLCLADVLDALTSLSDGLVDPPALQALIIAHLVAFQAAYGVFFWIPKHFWRCICLGHMTCLVC